MRAVQKFSSEYLRLCKEMKPEQIAKFLEEFRLIHGNNTGSSLDTQSKLISMKVQKRLLNVFKQRCKLLEVPYQTQIKKLMVEWLNKG